MDKDPPAMVPVGLVVGVIALLIKKGIFQEGDLRLIVETALSELEVPGIQFERIDEARKFLEMMFNVDGGSASKSP
ncbi:MAG TPA: hypothetical protein VME69_10245 [Methylocella sp.]|nr:hypothetical protein [Methylocella sp.]